LHQLTEKHRITVHSNTHKDLRRTATEAMTENGEWRMLNSLFPIPYSLSHFSRRSSDSREGSNEEVVSGLSLMSSSYSATQPSFSCIRSSLIPCRAVASGVHMFCVAKNVRFGRGVETVISIRLCRVQNHSQVIIVSQRIFELKFMNRAFCFGLVFRQL